MNREACQRRRRQSAALASQIDDQIKAYIAANLKLNIDEDTGMLQLLDGDVVISAVELPAVEEESGGGGGD